MKTGKNLFRVIYDVQSSKLTRFQEKLQTRGSLKVQLHYFYAAGTRVRLDSPHPSLWHKHALTHALRFLQIPGVKSVDNVF